MQRLARTLARAVIPAFARLGTSPAEYLAGQLEHTDLEWQTPPMRPVCLLGGVELHHYMDLPVSVQEEPFYAFYADTVSKLHHQPEKVLDPLGYKHLGRSVYLSRAICAYWLSTPEGYPKSLTDYAGVIFSMECANLLKQTPACKQFVSDDSNFYVVTRSGLEIGVKAGRPLEGYSEWDLSAEGVVSELLLMPRGNITTYCSYDVIAKMRSFLWERRDTVAEFEGVDTALQILRTIDGSTALLSQMQLSRKTKYTTAARLKLLERALETAQAPDLSDRQKITTLRRMLVPSVFGVTKFSKEIYAYNTEVPPMLQDRVMERIRSNLTDLVFVEKELNAIAL